MSNIKRMIRRADVTEVLYKMLTVSKDESEKECIARLWEQIKGIPVEDIVPVVHGKWVLNENDDMFYCTNCKNGSVRNDYPYCHWCGAKMDEVTE